MQYTEILKFIKKEMKIFRRKNWMFCLFFLHKTFTVDTRVPNLCFGTKIRKYVYPCKAMFKCIKVGFKGILFMDMLSL